MKLTPPYTAKLIDVNEDSITVTSNYAIIKANSYCSPEIISFFLNSRQAKMQIYTSADQSNTGIITISSIKNLNVKDIKDTDDLYTQLIKTFMEKKELTIEQLKIEEDMIEDMIFGD